MTREDWKCSKCGCYMLKTSSGVHLVCTGWKCRSKLRVAKQLMDLPVATRMSRTHYVLAGLYEVAFDKKGNPLKGWWKLVPSKHKKALDQFPDLGHVVARVWISRWKKWAPRTLRPIHPKIDPSPSDVPS